MISGYFSKLIIKVYIEKKRSIEWRIIGLVVASSGSSFSNPTPPLLFPVLKLKFPFFTLFIKIYEFDFLIKRNRFHRVLHYSIY